MSRTNLNLTSLDEFMSELNEDTEKDNRKYYYRAFLNPEKAGGTALIESTIHVYEPSANFGGEFSGNITLKDCNRQINLEFYFQNESQRQERLEKIRILEEQMSNMRAAIQNYEIKPKLEETKKKKRKKK